MKRMIAILVVAMLVLAIGTMAMAQEMMLKGTIKAIDAKANTMTVTTDDKKDVVISVDPKSKVYCHVGKADKNLGDFGVGNKVTVIYRVVDTKNVALYVGRTAKM